MTTAKQSKGMSWSEKRKIVKQCEKEKNVYNYRLAKVVNIISLLLLFLIFFLVKS